MATKTVTIATLRRVINQWDGYISVPQTSSLSTSRYFYVDIDDETIDVRQSDHVARPTYQLLYGEADFEIGEHQDADGDMLDFICWLAEKFNRPLPPDIARLKQERIDEAEARRAAERAEWERREAEREMIWERVRMMPDAEELLCQYVTAYKRKRQAIRQIIAEAIDVGDCFYGERFNWILAHQGIHLKSSSREEIRQALQKPYRK